LKKEIRGFILGVISTTMVFGVTAAYAGGITQTIEVIFNNVNLKVNGHIIDAQNILYKGTTYVPLRAVSDMFGKEVGWDGNTNTASINDKNFHQDDSDEKNQSDNGNSVFADINIETVVRKQVNKLTGELTKEDLESVKTLQVWQAGVKNINGIQKLTNLEELELTQSQISDLSALSTLKSLKRLGLFGNQITDLTPLRNLTNLESLNLRVNNELRDITSLENLVNLKELFITDTQLSDISPLVKLVQNGGFKSGIHGQKPYIMLHSNHINLKSTSTLKNLQDLIDKGIQVDYTPQQQQ
jgi:internalin A